jgi:hypothetical protein
MSPTVSCGRCCQKQHWSVTRMLCEHAHPRLPATTAAAAESTTIHARGAHILTCAFVEYRQFFPPCRQWMLPHAHQLSRPPSAQGAYSGLRPLTNSEAPASAARAVPTGAAPATQATHPTWTYRTRRERFLRPNWESYSTQLLVGEPGRADLSIRRVRSYATGATEQLRSELGPDFDGLRKPLQELQNLRNANPRGALTKHLLDAVGAILLRAQPMSFYSQSLAYARRHGVTVRRVDLQAGATPSRRPGITDLAGRNVRPSAASCPTCRPWAPG